MDKEKYTQKVEDPSICIVRISQDEKVTGQLAELLNPVDPKTMHEYRLEANSDIELHYHDFDEYWLFRNGRPEITLRSPNGVTKHVKLEPGDMIACVRGVEHTLKADHELVYFQFLSICDGDERGGHLIR